MYARRFLIVVFVLTLLAVAGAVAMFQFGSRVLIKSAVPRGEFQAPPPASGPDYSLASAWLARPGLQQPGNSAEWTPVGAPTPGSGGRPAALFYIHPTTYLRNDRWNAPARGSDDSDYRASLFLQSQASAFNDVAEIWAPTYRQAAYGAFLLKSEDAQKALDLSYSDIARAFDRFVAEAGDRPIILAGHSQGALHLARLLQEKVAGKPVAQRIAAAYVVGWPISTTADLPALGLPACHSAAQARCILSWMSFGNPANPDLILGQWEEAKGHNGGERRRKDMVCVNPITGTRDGAAAPAANPGTLVPSSNMRTANLQAGAVGAHCDDGLLILDGEIPALGPFVLPGNNYHVYDYALFWGAIRQDARRRLAAWQR